jgi:Flp pilus assembly protein TadG
VKNLTAKQHASERGQSLVEFAISIVILLLLVAGIVDLGRALFTYMAIRDAAQEGALYGSTDPTNNSAIENRARFSSNLLQGISNDPNADTEVNVSVSGSACLGGAITVEVVYNNFPLTMPLIGALIGQQEITIEASVTDTILRPACT